ncbi:MAG: hypothetical protein KatS3mg131_2936 [Candidatus Tectimicrobiota bacterium]|nr:MAG: hypothetical protein KatS3mg131_2936 [Candidatus Tectomicrobia bacterium]
MLYHLLFPLHQTFSAFNVFRYITFRTAYAALTALLVSLLLGPYVIRWLQKWQIGQIIRRDGPKSHYVKAGTPTMGGVLILGALCLSTLLWVDLTVVQVWLALGATLAFGAIGFWDDYRKISRRSEAGLRAKHKFPLQVLVAAVVSGLLYLLADPSWQVTRLAVPFFKEVMPDLGWFYFPFSICVIVGTSNAVNLTDGLDGLATGPLSVAAFAYAGIAYVAGHARFAAYLNIPYVPGAGELAVFCGAPGGGKPRVPLVQRLSGADFHGRCGRLGLGRCAGYGSRPRQA